MTLEKEFRVRKGLVVANTVLVTNGSNVGIGNNTPNETLTIEGSTSVKTYLTVAENSIINSLGISTNSLTVDGTASVAGNLVVVGTLVTTSTTNAAGDIIPTLNSTYNLGSSSFRWLNLNASNGNFVTYLNVGNSTINTAVNSTSVNVRIANTTANSFASLQVNTTFSSVSLSNGTVNTQLSIPTSTQYSSANVFLRANGSWGDVSSVVGGSNTQLQFNDSGSINGSANLIYTKSNSTLSTSNLVVSGSITGTVSNATNLGSLIWSSYVNAATLSSNLALYSNTAQMQGNVSTAYSNAVTQATNLAGNAYSNAISVVTANYVTNTNFIANLTNYPTKTDLTNNLANYTTTSLLTSNLANYQTTAGLSANVVTLTSNNSNYLGGTIAASYAKTTESVTFSGAVSDNIANLRTIPPNAQTAAYILGSTDVGKYVSITTGGITVPGGIFNSGDGISIYNNSGSSQTITQGTNVTLYLAGTATTGNRTLSQRGVATVLCVGSNTFVVTGSGLS